MAETNYGFGQEELAAEEAERLVTYVGEDGQDHVGETIVYLPEPGSQTPTSADLAPAIKALRQVYPDSETGRIKTNGNRGNLGRLALFRCL